jgi:hypothetical protein
MEAWGSRLRVVSGRLKTNKYLDTVHGGIGFWTDNGGYYHYSTGLNASATYEEALPQVRHGRLARCLRCSFICLFSHTSFPAPRTFERLKDQHAALLHSCLLLLTGQGVP